MKGEQEASVKTNIRSGEPVQNIINVNIWVDIYIAISSSQYIYMKTVLHTQSKNSRCNFSPSRRCGRN